MIFVDTSAFIALTSEEDKFQPKALAWWKKNKGIRLYTSNLIFIETMGWIRYKYGRKAAVRSGEKILAGDINIERVTSSDENAAWSLFQKEDGRSLSMIDCSSIILMKRLKIKDIFTFDRNFQKSGLNLLPSL